MTPKVSALVAIGEGVAWGMACWLKPYAALVGFSVWLVTLPSSSSVRRILLDTGLVVFGGCLAGLSGVAWLVQVGAWASWLETMRVWNPRYLVAGRDNWVLPRFEAMMWRMQPWYLLHLFALPLAASELVRIRRTLGQRKTNGDPPVATVGLGRVVTSGVYLATMLHVFFLQHLFDYVHAPAVLLAVTVIGIWLAQPTRAQRWRFAVLAFGILVAIQSPVFKPNRVRLWWHCVTNRSSPKLQDRLALLPNPHRTHLEKIAEFLQDKAASSGSVNILNSDLVGLYSRLNLRPPTRFIYMWELLLYFPKQRQEILSDLASSGHRYVVSDLISCGMPIAKAWEVGPDGPTAPPPQYQSDKLGLYPWSHRVIFRSGPYMVHEVIGSLGKPAAPPTQSDMKSLAKK